MEQQKVYELVEENMKTIFAYALSRVSHREDAQDLAGDIILAILGSAPRIRDDNAFFGYIWAIAANTYKKFLQRRNRIRYEELDDKMAGEEDFTGEILRAAEYNTLRRELALLSREYRECAIAYYFDGLSCAETASRLQISPEMVKYYLFKTRKILKEGISMEREFGQKSYQPAAFEFNAVFSGSANMEYQNLFNRKLPGNLLISAYYTPMTVRQLAIELGVASTYLEDEVALLEKYGLLTALPGGRYQSRLIIFTDDYRDEFFRQAEKTLASQVGDILFGAAKKLPRLRALEFPGSGLDDNRLLWALLFELINSGWRFYRAGRADAPAEGLYEGIDGICYANSCSSPGDPVYTAPAFAGYCGIDARYAASYADYGILPPGNRFSSHCADIAASLDGSLAGDVLPAVPVVSGEQKANILEILQEESHAFARLYESLYSCALSILKSHAPENMEQIADKVLTHVLFFHTVGLIGLCAVRSGALTIPEGDSPLGAMVYEIQR